MDARTLRIAALVAFLAPAGACLAQTQLPFQNAPMQLPDISTPQNAPAALQLILLLTVLSLAPAILLMMTSFTRIIIVFSLLRQAMGTQQLPPNQILIGLSLFMTFLIMQPTLKAVNDEALQPYLNGQKDYRVALEDAQKPLRKFMINQIVQWDNADDVLLFQQFAIGRKITSQDDFKFEDVSTLTLIPAYVLSELKIAFTMGFTIYLPFLVIDIVISSVLISMGMMMLPPVLISLPFKLLLFVLVNGWRLITANLMDSFVR